MIDLDDVLECADVLETMANKVRPGLAGGVLAKLTLRSVGHLREMAQELYEARAMIAAREPRRVKLPDDRDGINHEFTIYSAKETVPGVLIPYAVEGVLNVGDYPNGAPGEIFIRLEKEHSKLMALLDQFAIAISLLLQVGYPLRLLVKKFRHTKFEPSGRTSNTEIPSASSPTDYIFAVLERRYSKLMEE